MENSYETLHSPDGQTTLVMEYRDVTLGETNYIYEFYKKAPHFPVIERLDQDVHFFTRGRHVDSLQALGVYQAEWHDDYVVFHTITGKKMKVEWKDS